MAGVKSIPVERIDARILAIRGHKVMVDADLAELYGGNDNARISGRERMAPT